ncbi:MAG: aminotransferase class I/II-fold pyridoxal phosphate-dependent enzyme [Candidatus Edwardsbacteria bacterium]
MRYKMNTKVVHGGLKPDPATGAHVPPIYQTSTFVFKNAEEGAALFAKKKEGYIYTRLGNPTISALERKVAYLEGAEEGLAFASGMAAIFATIFALASNGAHLISDNTLYGGTFALFTNVLPKLGIKISLVDAISTKNIEKEIQKNTKLVYIETPTNPNLKVIDIGTVSRLCKRHRLPLIVDNTFATPYLQRPLEWGADIVIHSTTKYIGGHGDTIGGIMVGKKDFVEMVKNDYAINIGGCASPFNAFLNLRGLKTLAVRMKRHSENAMQVAKFLESHKKVKRVFYPGLTSHPQHTIAKKQMSDFGGMVAFELTGGREAGRRVCNSVKLCTLAVSLGDTDTLIEHPASMTHYTYSEEECLKFGITPGLIRLSVGLEDAEDIIEDLKQALEKA